MAVGFGAIRRSVSEDLIVSSHNLIRKYTVVISLCGMSYKSSEDKRTDVSRTCSTYVSTTRYVSVAVG